MAIGRIPEPGTGIPESIVDAKGDLVTATAADTPARLAVGSNEQRLVADSAAATGLKYVADTTNYAIAAKGDLLVGTAADTLQALTVGTNGHTLVADSSTSTGLKWSAPASGGGMTSIASGNLSSNTVTISDISGSYVDLVLYVRDFYFAGEDYLCFRLNGATGDSYGFMNIVQSAENTAAVGCDGIRDRLFFIADDKLTTSDKNTFATADIPDYANTSHHKVVKLRGLYRSANNAYESQAVTFGNFASTSAITSITLFTQNTNNFSGGTYELYGVK